MASSSSTHMSGVSMKKVTIKLDKFSSRHTPAQTKSLVMRGMKEASTHLTRIQKNTWRSFAKSFSALIRSRCTLMATLTPKRLDKSKYNLKGVSGMIIVKKKKKFWTFSKTNGFYSYSIKSCSIQGFMEMKLLRRQRSSTGSQSTHNFSNKFNTRWRSNSYYFKTQT